MSGFTLTLGQSRVATINLFHFYKANNVRQLQIFFHILLDHNLFHGLCHKGCVYPSNIQLVFTFPTKTLITSMPLTPKWFYWPFTWKLPRLGLGVSIFLFWIGCPKGPERLTTVEIEDRINMSSVIHPTLKWNCLEFNSKSTNNQLTPIKLEYPFMFRMESLCSSGLLCKVKEIHTSIAKSLFTISGIRSKKDTKGLLLSIVPLFIITRSLMYFK